MSAFYDSSSLVFLPSGYKDGKLYSQKPLSTSGELAFSRGSDIEATRVNSQGYIEKAKVNLLLQSNSFDQSPYTTYNIGSVTNGFSGYDGTSDAWTINPSGVSASLRQTQTINGVLTTSVYAKAGVATWMRLGWYDGGDKYSHFDLSNGTIGTETNIIDSTITSVGGGWYKCTVTANTTSATWRVYPMAGDNDTNVNAGDTILIQDAALCYGLVAQDYVETTTAAVVTGITNDMPRLSYDPANPTCPSLLLEPSATAINQDSENFSGSYWTKGDLTVEQNTSETLDPSGNYSASKLTETATTARHRLLSGAVTMSAVNNTSSVFLKKGTARYGFVTMSGAATSTIVVDLEDGTITDTSTSGTIVAQKVENYGGGWYRISVTALGIAASTSANLQFGSAGSATPSYTANIPSFAGSTSNYLYAWGANLTNTGYLQSYLPTYGTSATRTADACYKTGISSLIGQTEGTIFLEFDNRIMTSYPNEYIFRIIGSDSDQIWLRKESGSAYFTARLITNSSTVIWTISSIPVLDGNTKIAISYKTGDSALYLNGTQFGTSSATFSGTDFSDFYFNFSGTVNPELKLNQALLFKTRLSNADLATLTSL